MPRSLRVPILIALLLLAMALPSLLGCACGGFSLLPLVSHARCTPPPPVTTPTTTVTGAPEIGTVTPANP